MRRARFTKNDESYTPSTSARHMREERRAICRQHTCTPASRGCQASCCLARCAMLPRRTCPRACRTRDSTYTNNRKRLISSRESWTQACANRRVQKRSGSSRLVLFVFVAHVHEVGHQARVVAQRLLEQGRALRENGCAPWIESEAMAVRGRYWRGPSCPLKKEIPTHRRWLLVTLEQSPQGEDIGGAAVELTVL